MGHTKKNRGHAKVETEKAPKAIGPYSQAVAAGDFIFLSGQIPLDPAKGELVSGDVRTQCAQAFKNIEAVLAASGADFRDVVSATVYLKNISDFSAMNEVYAQHFTTDPKPARTTVGVAELPKGALVEIACIAKKEV